MWSSNKLRALLGKKMNLQKKNSEKIEFEMKIEVFDSFEEDESP